MCACHVYAHACMIMTPFAKACVHPHSDPPLDAVLQRHTIAHLLHFLCAFNAAATLTDQKTCSGASIGQQLMHKRSICAQCLAS